MFDCNILFASVLLIVGVASSPAYILKYNSVSLRYIIQKGGERFHSMSS